MKIWETMYMSQPPLKRKGHVRNCHGFASVVCKRCTFYSSSPKSFGILEQTLTITFIMGFGCILKSKNYWFWSEIQHDWPIMCPDWLKSKQMFFWEENKWEYLTNKMAATTVLNITTYGKMYKNLLVEITRINCQFIRIIIGWAALQ